MKALLLIATLAACAESAADPKPAPKQPPPTEPAPTERFEHDMMVRFHMHENFDLLRAIEKLLIRGKLDDAKAFARAIAQAPDEPGLGPFTKHATRVRDLAAALAEAPNLDEGCHREARLAVACAGCHADAGVVPELSKPPALPPDAASVEARMARHLWATDRLWEASIGGGDEPWTTGLDVLAATPLPFRDAMGTRAKLARQLQQLADGARKRKRTDTVTDRGRAYGDILSVCASCHTTAVVPLLPSTP
jgi:mono/diheme cytochrome c family protein